MQADWTDLGTAAAAAAVGGWLTGLWLLHNFGAAIPEEEETGKQTSENAAGIYGFKMHLQFTL
jgi:hypothetical protein